MQFHLSSPLHSFVGHSISFRCSDADVAVLVDGDKEGGEEGRDSANDELLPSRSLPFLHCLSKTNLFFTFSLHRLFFSPPPLSYLPI